MGLQCALGDVQGRVQNLWVSVDEKSGRPLKKHCRIQPGLTCWEQICVAKSYKATGINLKGVPMGETDRLLTVLTAEYGLLRAIAPGSRKHESSLRGRSGLFVVNHLLLVQGRSLDKIIQAETIASYPGLSLDLAKLTSAQYLAELALSQAVSGQPQTALFSWLQAYLTALEQAPASQVLPLLVCGLVALLRLAGVAPEVNQCAVTQKPLKFVDKTQALIGFHPAAGGIVSAAVFERLCDRDRLGATDLGDPTFASPAPVPHNGTRDGRGSASTHSQASSPWRVRQTGGTYRKAAPRLGTQLSHGEWQLLRQLATQTSTSAPNDEALATIPSLADLPVAPDSWLAVERALRYYAQYHFERAIQSAHLIDACFAPFPSTQPPKP